MRNKYKYKAFISYNHVDEKWARWLHRTLETYRVPSRLIGRQSAFGPIPPRLSPVFRDRDDLPSSPDLSRRIAEALENSEFLLVICSPAATKSVWVNKEIELFKKLGRSQYVVCLIVAGDPSVADTNNDCYPPALRQRYDDAGNLVAADTQPIAADLRRDKDGQSLARLKIIAGMIGIDLDELRQREAHRQQRRMAVITVSSLMAAGLTLVLAFSAMVARDDANRRRQQAEDLLSFMVGDLRRSLTPIGRLDLLEEVGQQAMNYFSAVDVSNLTDTELLMQSQVLTQLGEIRISQLQYDEALASFNEAYERSAVLQRNSPSDGERLFNRSQAEFWVGFVYWRDGSLVDARKWLSQYRDSAVELFALDPSRNDWLQEVAYGHHNLAVLNQDSGDLDAAIEGFNLAINIFETLLERNPNDQIARNQADAYSFLGNVAIMQGFVVEALARYQQSADVIRSLVNANPEDAEWLEDLAFALQLVAEAAAMTGDLDFALSQAEEASAIFAALVARDATNLNWVRASVRPQITKGQVFAALQRWLEAFALADAAVILLNGIIEAGNADVNVRSQNASALILKAWTQDALGDARGAMSSIDLAFSILSTLEQEDRLNDERLGLIASLYVMRGEINRSLGQQNAAASDWQSAHDLLEQKAPLGDSPFLLDPWARVLRFLGRQEEGEAVSDALQVRRYVPLMPWPD